MSFKQQAIILGLLVLSFGVGAQVLAASTVQCTRGDGVHTENIDSSKSPVAFFDDVKWQATDCLTVTGFKSVEFFLDYSSGGVSIKGTRKFDAPMTTGPIFTWLYGLAPSILLDTNTCRCTANNTTTLQKLTVEVKRPETLYESIEKNANACTAKSNLYKFECSIDYASTTSPVVSLKTDTAKIFINKAEVTAWLASVKTLLVTPPVQGGVDPGTVTGGDKDAGTVVGGDSGTKAADDGSLVPPGCRGDAPLDTCGLSQIEELIVRVIKLILGLSGSLALLMFVYGGTLYIMAGGVPSMAGKGKSAMTNAVIGLILVLCARLILSSILRALVTG